MSNGTAKRSRIFVFNLETDLDSLVLAAAHDWIEELSSQYESVEVYSTHVGRTNLAANVSVLELGGGSALKKLRNLCQLFRVVFRLWKFRKSATVFHHMSSRTLAIIGFPIRIMGIPQGIWYSHSRADLSLKIGRHFANAIFSSTESAIPVKGKKVFYLGHGIKILEARSEEIFLNPVGREGIVSLGRIARVKHLEEILFELNVSPKMEIPVTFIGPLSDSTYSKELLDLARKLEITLSIVGPMPHSHISTELRKYKYIFSGTPMSVDKALLEGALAGCFVVTSNSEAINLSGMGKVWERLNIFGEINTQDQLRILESVSVNSEYQLRQLVTYECRKRNDLGETIKKIRNILGGTNLGIEE
jgi:hypothetical protein